MNKKAMDQQIFVYIFTIVVVGLILAFGIKMIMGVKDTAKSVETVKFKKDIDNKVQKLFTYSIGSKAKLEMKQVPSQIKAVCFIDLTTPVSLSNIPYDDVKLLAEAESGTRTNVFFAGKKDIIDPIKVSRLKPKENPLCITITTRGTLEAVLENTGSEVTLSR